VSAYGEPTDINQSFEDYLKWIEEHEKSRDTPILLTLDDMWAMAQSKSTYKEEVNGTTYYYIRLTREQAEYIKTHPDEFNASWYYSTSPPEEEYKWSDDDLNISQWDDEYPPKEPKLTELDGEWTEVDESIFKMYPIHNPPTIYVMQVASGWDYHTFKLPIYRRI
jgi:hypothetical protein